MISAFLSLVFFLVGLIFTIVTILLLIGSYWLGFGLVIAAAFTGAGAILSLLSSYYMTKEKLGS
jgi:hypothetical protein